MLAAADSFVRPLVQAEHPNVLLNNLVTSNMPSSISKLPRIPSAHGAGVREPALATRRSSLPMMPKRTTSAVVGDPVANGEDVRDAARASRHSSLSTVAERVMSLVDGDPGPLPTSWGGRPVAGGEGVLDSACAIRRSSLKGVLDSARDSLRSGSLSMRPGRSMTTVSVAKIDQFHFEKEGASYRLQVSIPIVSILKTHAKSSSRGHTRHIPQIFYHTRNLLNSLTSTHTSTHISTHHTSSLATTYTSPHPQPTPPPARSRTPAHAIHTSGQQPIGPWALRGRSPPAEA